MGEKKKAVSASLLAPRPLSPHLTVYRWYLTMALSIFHRASGAFLVLGTVTISLWLLAIAHGPEYYDSVIRLIDHPVGQLLLLGWSAAFYFHLLNGIRHLFWDIGLGLVVQTANFTAIIVLLGTLLMTAFTWRHVWLPYLTK